MPSINARQLFNISSLPTNLNLDTSETMDLSVYQILVASNASSITSLFFDPCGPTFNVTSETVVGPAPTWITGHPTNPSLAFTGLTSGDGIIVALTFNDTGNGTVVGHIPSEGTTPASLLTTKDALFVANYDSGTVMAAPLSGSPPYFLDEPPRAALQLNGSGPNTVRQGSSHPHQVVAVPGRNEILVPDLGSDRTWRLAYDNRRGKLSLRGSVTYPPGTGPRHAVFHNDILYTVSELTSNLFAHHLLPLPALPTLLSMTSTLQLQPGEALGERVAAELLLAPALKEDACNGSGDGSTHSAPFLYATNRNDPSAAGDTVAIFSLEDPANPTLIAEVHTGLQHLRGAMIGGEDGRWMVVGGMMGGGVKVYERVDGGRSLKEIAALPDIEGPTNFLWLTPRKY